MKTESIAKSPDPRLREPQHQLDARVEKLWKELDPKDKGELDLKGLQKGLRKIDHRELPHGGVGGGDGGGRRCGCRRGRRRGRRRGSPLHRFTLLMLAFIFLQ